MSNKTYLSLFAGILLGISIYQNCGQVRNIKQGDISLSDKNLYADKEILIRLKNSESRNQLLSWSQSHGMKSENEWEDISTFHFSWTENSAVPSLVAESKAMLGDALLFAEPNFLYKKESIGDDFHIYSTAEITSNTSSTQTTAPIQFKETWPTLPATGEQPIVAVIDSGIDSNHNVFIASNSLWKNAGEVPSNGLDDDKNGFIDDVNGWDFANGDNIPNDDEGHGTHVSGIILGTGQDIFSTTISASRIKIMPLKFLDSTGNGKTSAAIDAIYYAVRNGAKVINNSWGGSSYSQALVDAIAYAYSNKVLVVVAAGNEAKSIDVSPTYPASIAIPNVLPVSATSNSDQITAFSNFGVKTVQIAAPGQAILSTYPNNMFATLSGTSMATPFVAGTAALMIYERPLMTGYQVRSILISQSDKLQNLSNFVWEKGRLNVLKSVDFAKNVTLDPTQPSYTLASTVDTGPTRGGCGLVLSQAGGKSKGPPAPPVSTFFILLLPIFVVFFERFKGKRTGI